MTNYNRRRFLGDLALASASSLALSALACKKEEPVTPKPQTLTSSSLYLILQGPWLLSVGASNLTALTLEPNPSANDHLYTYYDPRLGSYSNPKYRPAAKDVLSFSVSRTGATPSGAQVLQFLKPLKDLGEGLYFNGSVSLTPNDATVRTSNFDFPDNILVAGLISTVSFALNNSTINSAVSSWPSALIFVYSNWSSATLKDSSGNVLDTVQPSGNVGYRKFDIHRKINGTVVNLCQDDADHATHYFNRLMDQLTFSQSAKRPVITFPTCPYTANITLGGDGNITCRDIDPCGSWCGAQCKDQRGPTLVNCAAGGGGILGCC